MLIHYYWIPPDKPSKGHREEFSGTHAVVSDCFLKTDISWIVFFETTHALVMKS